MEIVSVNGYVHPKIGNQTSWGWPEQRSVTVGLTLSILGCSDLTKILMAELKLEQTKCN